jgi:hypothetical protein
MAEDGCVVCGKPRAPKDGVDDRCGHHRRQYLRNLAKQKGLPTPTRRRGPTQRTGRRVATPPESPLEAVTPTQLKDEHLSGKHDKFRAVACVLCIRAAGGSIGHVEMIRESPGD